MTDGLETREDEAYWKPLLGKTYRLWMHSDDQEETNGIFFGINSGRYIFLREKEGRLMVYSSSPDTPACWDGHTPCVDASFDF